MSSEERDQSNNEDTARCCASFKCTVMAFWIMLNFLVFLGGGILLTSRKMTITTALAIGIPIGVLTLLFAICGCCRPNASLAFGFFQPNNTNNNDVRIPANEQTPLIGGINS